MEKWYQKLFNLFRGSKIVTSIQPLWMNHATYSSAEFESLVKNVYFVNELVYSCIHKTASTAAQISLLVCNRKTGEPLPTHPLKQLIQKPNAFMSEFDLWYAVTSFLLLAGMAAFEKERDRLGRVVALWALRPDYLEPVIQNRTEVVAYKYRMPMSQEVLLDSKDVVVFRVWDLLGRFSSVSPARMALRVAQVDSDLTDLIKVVFQEGGSPMGVIKTKQRLREEQVLELRTRWRQRYGGWRNWIEPAVLDSDAEYQRIGFSFEELQAESLNDRLESRICMIFGIPPIVLGSKFGLDRSTYANYESAKRSWWEDQLVPMYENYLDVIQNQLANEFADDVEVVWDFSHVPALAENQKSKMEISLEALKAGAITVNEFRDALGLKRLEDGDIVLRPANVFAESAEVSASKELKIFPEHDEALIRAYENDLKKYYKEQLSQMERELTKNA